MPETAVVTGANRGIGLELVRQLSAHGGTVIGTARDPNAASEARALGVRVEKLDLADLASIAAFAKRLRKDPVDLLVNNAAIRDASGAVECVGSAELEEYFRVNAVGPFLLTQALLPNLRAGGRKLAVSISSGLGSIGQNRDGGWVGYRASKAALNQLVRTLAAELTREGLTFVLLSPGWVRTRMGGQDAPLSPEQSVNGLLKVIDRLSAKDSGKFLDHRGKEVPW